jgi:hypothetical protein
MAVNTRWVTCLLGQWTQVSNYDECRETLIVQLLGGVAILAVNTSGPITANEFGQCPAGIFHSCDLGNGPGTFRLGACCDGELVKQAWYAFVVSTPDVVSDPFTQLNSSSGFPGCSVTYTIPAGVVMIGTITYTTGGDPNIVTSALLGVLTPTATAQSAAVGGLIGATTVYLINHPGGTDTITLANAGGGSGAIIAWSVAGTGPMDGSGSVVSAGAAWSVAASSGDVYVAEVGVLVINIESAIGAPSATPNTPWTPLMDSSDTFGGDHWDGSISWAPFTGLNTIVTATGNAVRADAAVTAAVFGLQAGAAGGAVITVLESFHEPPPGADGTVTEVKLPALSPGAQTALAALRAKFAAPDAKTPLQEYAADAISHDSDGIQPDSGNDADDSAGVGDQAKSDSPVSGRRA